MKQLSSVKKSILTALCIALCVVLPLALHAVPDGGTIYSPMHLPVLLCGLVCGWPFGLLCGVAGPLLSSLLTQMPPAAYLPAMLVELAAYGVLSGLLMQWVHTGKRTADLYISLLGAMVGGRLLAGAAKALFFAAGSYSLSAWAAAYFVVSLPGMILQLILLPVLYTALEKSALIPPRYAKRQNIGKA